MKKIIFAAVLAFSLGGCYYDNFEELYPLAGYSNTCDTTGTVTYANHIAPLLNNYCNSCHSSSTASGGIMLDNYAGVKTAADNGKLLGAVKQQSGYIPMPPNTQLDQCGIKEIEMWVQSGAPNN